MVAEVFPRGMLRRREDRAQVAAVGVAFLGIHLPMFIPLPLWGRALWILGSTFACFRAHVVIHNHMHRRVFRGLRANACFHVVASLARGHTVCDTLLPHLHNHHPLRGGKGDWVGPHLAGEGWGLFRLLRFVLVSTYTMQRERRRSAVAEEDYLPRVYRLSRPFEKGTLMGAILFGLAWDWRIFLGHQVLPWLISLAMLVAINLFQHDGCEPSSEHGNSRNFTGSLLNALCFNNGYHTVHHAHPDLHWRDLPAAHAKEAGAIPERCNETSLPRYLWREVLSLRTWGRAV